MFRLTKVLAAAVVVVGMTIFSCGPGGKETLCDNGIDDDKNGATDCLDPSCASLAICQPVDGGNETFEACATQKDCLDAGWNLDRPLRACKGQRCQRQGGVVAVRFEANTASMAGDARKINAMSTRFISRVGLDNSTVTCATVTAAALGNTQTDADQLERSGKFNYLAYDVLRVSAITPGTTVPNPFLYTATGDNFVIWNELWSQAPDSNTKLPTGTRMSAGCFDSLPQVNPITTADNCLDGGTGCRTIVVAMPRNPPDAGP